MTSIAKLAALILLAIILIDGAFDQSNFDPWDYRPDISSGVFTLMRIVVAIAAWTTAWNYWTLYRIGFNGAFVWITIFGLVGILYQPVIEIHFSYHTWLWIDLFVFLIFFTEHFGTTILGLLILGSMKSDWISESDRQRKPKSKSEEKSHVKLPLTGSAFKRTETDAPYRREQISRGQTRWKERATKQLKSDDKDRMPRAKELLKQLEGQCQKKLA